MAATLPADLPALGPRPAWQRRAACAGMPVALFFDPSRRDEAGAVCRSCPVRAECLAYELSFEGPHYGVWGGHDLDRRARNGSRNGAPRRSGVRGDLHLGNRMPFSGGTTTDHKEAPPMAKKTTKAPRTKSTTSRDGKARCPSCRKTLPVTKFPTRRNAEGTYERDTSECRSCRDERRAANKGKDAA